MKTQTFKITNQLALTAFAIFASLSQAHASQISTEQCLANLNADLKAAVAATISNDRYGVKAISNFRYSGFASDGDDGASTTYVFTAVYPQGALQLAGHVALTPECRIAGTEKFLGLNYVTVAMKLK